MMNILEFIFLNVKILKNLQNGGKITKIGGNLERELLASCQSSIVEQVFNN